jgi:beta-xylosidase
MKRTFAGLTIIWIISGLSPALAEPQMVTATYSAIDGLERDQTGFLRRDNSDIIKVGDLYYVWYSKMRQFVPDQNLLSTVWYATSPDGQVWTEQGESIPLGDEGSWEDVATFTPGILVAENKYYLTYTAVDHFYKERSLEKSKTRIGMAVADSPDGPWVKLATNPIIEPSAELDAFDSHRVDDSCFITRNGKYWMYYKGRQWGKKPMDTHMGVAIAENPEGPYVKHEANPLVGGNHEVLVWSQGEGVAALIGNVTGGKRNIVPYSVMYAKDGLHFNKTHELTGSMFPWAAGAYRPGSFTDSGNGRMIEWGLHISGERPDLFLERFDLHVDE